MLDALYLIAARSGLGQNEPRSCIGRILISVVEHFSRYLAISGMLRVHAPGHDQVRSCRELIEERQVATYGRTGLDSSATDATTFTK